VKLTSTQAEKRANREPWKDIFDLK